MQSQWCLTCKTHKSLSSCVHTSEGACSLKLLTKPACLCTKSNSRDTGPSLRHVRRTSFRITQFSKKKKSIPAALRIKSVRTNPPQSDLKKWGWTELNCTKSEAQRDLHRKWRHHPGTLPYPTCCVYLLCLFCLKYDDDVSTIPPNRYVSQVSFVGGQFAISTHQIANLSIAPTVQKQIRPTRHGGTPLGSWGCVLYGAAVGPVMQASPSTCRVLIIDWQVRGLCRCLWYTRGLCLCPCAITPRGFTSLTGGGVYIGVYSNKQIKKQKKRALVGLLNCFGASLVRAQ